MGVMGFASGLPLALSGSTLQAWLVTRGVDIHQIGWLSLTGIPYTWKFLWAPWVDTHNPPWGQGRLGWLSWVQALLWGLLCLWLWGMSESNFIWLLPWAFGLAFLSATQDLLVDGYRVDILPTEERGLGVAWSVSGYRLAMFCSGALALLIAAHWGWSLMVWFLLGCLGLCWIWSNWLAPVPLVLKQKEAVAFFTPLKEFYRSPYAKKWLALVVFYKLGEALTTALTSVFLIQGMGFSLVQVATVNKGMGLLATLLGSFVGGVLMLRWSLYRSLWVFGACQALASLAYGVLAWVGGHSVMGLALAVFIENFTGGLGTAALVAFMMTVSHGRYSASQFALLSALASTGRVYMGPVAAYLVPLLGWVGFYELTVLVALPGLMLVFFAKQDLLKLA